MKTRDTTTSITLNRVQSTHLMALLFLISTTTTTTIFSIITGTHAQNTDRFNYGATDWTARDFGPQHWANVQCDDLETCQGWPDDWLLGVEWGLEQNTCLWCPDDGTDLCGRHHQSPINLHRNRAIIGHAAENECIDVHWMKYEDGSCAWDDLTEHQAFSIERHALKITQPIERIQEGQQQPQLGEQDDHQNIDEGLRLACPGKSGARRFGRIDFSKGFSDWWFLSHIDFKVPSEHTQEGKRYDAEIQMAHFYSVSAQQAGVANEMAHVSIFLEAYDDAPPYPYLDRVICQWRRAEEKIREQCGLPSVQPYPTCFNPTRGHTNPTNNPTTNPTQPPTSPPAVVVDIPPFSILPITNTTESTHETSTSTTTTSTTTSTTIDTLITNSNTSTISSVSSRGFNPDQSQTGGSKRRLRATANDILRETKTTKKKRKIQMDPINWREPDWTEQEWEQFIQAYSAHTNGNASQSQRKLLEGSHSIYHNYQPLIDVKTEYYYRYSGTQTAPPCYGPFTPETRGNTNHWRVMKDPIRVHPRQIKEMHRLLRERTAPSDDPNTDNACKTDTAAKIVNEETGEISVARPLQSFHQSHFKTFCECKDWKSKWPEDQAWCEIDSGDYTASYSRFYQQPYNFQTHGQF